MTPNWFTPARQAVLEAEYPAGVAWLELYRHLVDADPDAAPVPGRRAAADLMNARGVFRPTAKHCWSDLETAMARGLAARRALRADYAAAFPHLNWNQIAGHLRVMGIPSPPRPHRVRPPSIPRRASPVRNVRLDCLCCGRSFMSWDRARNRLCDDCPSRDVSHAVEPSCYAIIRLRA